MSFQITTTIQINATPEKVWQELLNFKEYPTWNPFIKEIKGTPKKGARLEVDMQGMTFKPVVLQCRHNKEFTWRGSLFINGLFDGEHSFLLEQKSSGTTQFTQSEKFSGILVPLLKGKLQKETKEQFKAMNAALKKRME